MTYCVFALMTFIGYLFYLFSIVFVLMTFIVYLFRLLKLLTVAGRFMRVFNLVFVILLLGHWNGCLQWLVPMLQDFPRDSWAAIEGLQVGGHMSLLGNEGMAGHILSGVYNCAKNKKIFPLFSEYFTVCEKLYWFQLNFSKKIMFHPKEYSDNLFSHSLIISNFYLFSQQKTLQITNYNENCAIHLFQLQIRFYNCRNYDQLHVKIKLCPVEWEQIERGNERINQ